MSNATVRAAFQRGKAFIPFITAGDPDFATTKAIVRQLADAGASIIELGIPFSDPTAEGPVIQEANNRSLAGGTTTDSVLDMVEELRRGTDGNPPVEVPLLAMTYANVVFHYGISRFCQRAREAGLDGIILPDVPFEEKAEFAEECARCDLAYISLIAPTSDQRVAMIAREADGFIYLVSSLGVTGTRAEIVTDIDSLVAQIREVTDVPVAIGFGISTPDAAREMAGKADGAIVGSALVKLVAEHGMDSPGYVGQLARDMVARINQ